MYKVTFSKSLLALLMKSPAFLLHKHKSFFLLLNTLLLIQTLMSVPDLRLTSVETTLCARTSVVPTLANVTKVSVKGVQDMNVKVYSKYKLMLCFVIYQSIQITYRTVIFEGLNFVGTYSLASFSFSRVPITI